MEEHRTINSNRRYVEQFPIDCRKWQCRIFIHQWESEKIALIAPSKWGLNSPDRKPSERPKLLTLLAVHIAFLRPSNCHGMLIYHHHSQKFLHTKCQPSNIGSSKFPRLTKTEARPDYLPSISAFRLPPQDGNPSSKRPKMRNFPRGHGQVVSGRQRFILSPFHPEWRSNRLLQNANGLTATWELTRAFSALSRELPNLPSV